MSTEIAVRLEGVTKRYGPVTALDGAGFKLGRGETVALLGPNGGRQDHHRRDMDVTSLRQRLRLLPAPVIDAGLAVAVGVAATIAVPMAPPQETRPDGLAYALGLTIAALVLVRRRWPVAVLVASAATLQLYYMLDYAGIRPAVPLSVAPRA